MRPLLELSPQALRHVRIAGSFDELISTPFAGDVNALCWPRRLAGDFAEVVDRLAPGAGITTIGDDDLELLPLSPAGCLARQVLLADQELLRGQGLDPILDCITGYPRDETSAPVETDVYSFHADSATVAADTWLCTYTGACSEGLANAEAIRRADVPETRAKLLALYGGLDDEGFAEYLSSQCYDLHYSALPGARPYAFGIGHMWRVAISYPGCPVLPCIHRAPRSLPGSAARLLLIS